MKNSWKILIVFLLIIQFLDSTATPTSGFSFGGSTTPSQGFGSTSGFSFGSTASPFGSNASVLRSLSSTGPILSSCENTSSSSFGFFGSSPSTFGSPASQPYNSYSNAGNKTFSFGSSSPVGSVGLSNTINNKMNQIILLQGADGSWKMDQNLCRLLDVQPTEVLHWMDSLQLPKHLSQFWATCLAIAYLSTVFANVKDDWILLANKANQYIENCKVNNSLANKNWVDEAKTIMLTHGKLKM